VANKITPTSLRKHIGERFVVNKVSAEGVLNEDENGFYIKPEAGSRYRIQQMDELVYYARNTRMGRKGQKQTREFDRCERKVKSISIITSESIGTVKDYEKNVEDFLEFYQILHEEVRKRVLEKFRLELIAKDS
jgi:hypothetical protein